jgi:hypothetical protein
MKEGKICAEAIEEFVEARLKLERAKTSTAIKEAQDGVAAAKENLSHWLDDLMWTAITSAQEGR